jgi:hypothetical protein
MYVINTENPRVIGSIPILGTFEIKGFAVFCEAFLLPL